MPIYLMYSALLFTVARVRQKRQVRRVLSPTTLGLVGWWVGGLVGWCVGGLVGGLVGWWVGGLVGWWCGVAVVRWWRAHRLALKGLKGLFIT